MEDDRRLIEDYLPIQEISIEASKEKSIRKGHISTLHLWWARRPLVACRAAVYGALVTTSQFASGGSSEKIRSKERESVRRFISQLCKYSIDKDVITQAQEHILNAHAKRLSIEHGKQITVNDILTGKVSRPKVLDMFAGGGAIPLEALRLGCETYAFDLNPVAHIIQLCTLVYPQKYGKPDPAIRGMNGSKNEKGETTWGGLEEEVRYWGNWVLEKVKKEIEDLYPQISDPDAEPEEISPKKQRSLFEGMETQPSLKVFSEHLTPVVYLWTRTVKCKNPLCGATVPLVKQTWLHKKENSYAAMQVLAVKGEKCVQFKVVEAKKEADLGFDPTGFSKGGNAACYFCGTVADSEYVKSESCSQRMGQQLMAIVCVRSGKSGKKYISASDLSYVMPTDQEIQKRIERLCKDKELSLPDEPMNTQDPTTLAGRGFGVNKWSQLFTARQLLCLLTFTSVVKNLFIEIQKKQGDEEIAKAICTYIGVIVDRLADFNSVLCSWKESAGHTFSRQALPMVWDFSEINPFSGGTGSWASQLMYSIEHIQTSSECLLYGQVQRGSATSLPWQEEVFDAIITDPPYYDNISYAVLSDFFYVWLKRTIGHLHPEHFSTEVTPKKMEIISDVVRHNGVQTARLFYESAMAKALSEANRVLKTNGQIIIVYAHKTTLGWATLVEALRKARFTVSEAWPLDTEMKGRLIALDSSALASSIFLVARKRGVDKTGSYEDEVRPELEQIVRERVETLWEMGITGADLIIAAVGAGLRAFTRFAKVEYLNGDEVPAERFLSEVEGVVLETLLKKIFEDISKQENTDETESEPVANQDYSGVSNVDPQTRFYILWRYTYGRAEIDAGEAIVFAYPQDVELEGRDGIAQGSRALAEKKKTKYRLRDFTERGERVDLGLPDSANTQKNAPTLIDVLHRVLWLVENEPAKIGEYLQEAKPDKEKLRLVAQALAGPGLKGGEADAKLINTTPAETSALGKLLANWRQLVDTYLEDFHLRG